MAYPVELVRDIAQHHGGSDVRAVQDTLTANTVVLIVGMTTWTKHTIGTDQETIGIALARGGRARVGLRAVRPLGKNERSWCILNGS